MYPDHLIPHPGANNFSNDTEAERIPKLIVHIVLTIKSVRISVGNQFGNQLGNQLYYQEMKNRTASPLK